MTNEWIHSFMAVLFAGFICLAMIVGEVHTWKIDVIPVGKYLWAFVSTGVFFACTWFIVFVRFIAGYNLLQALIL